MQRIYGTAWFDKKDLKNYLQMREEANVWELWGKLQTIQSPEKMHGALCGLQ